VNWRKTDELPLGMTPDDLPAWMRSARREVDWALWAAVGLCLIVIWPLLAQPGLPQNTETQGLIYRTIEIAESLQDGVLYPRWAPDFNHGYGSPLFNYVPPLPHYLAGMVRVLFQISIENSIKVVFAFGMTLNGLACFGFVRRRWGAIPGILALAIYLFNPQLLLVKPYLQGDLYGMLALGWFWLALWALERVLAGESRWNVALVSVSVMGLWLSHGSLSIVLTGIALGWVWVRAVGAPRTLFHAHGWHIVLAVGSGIGGAAFFWLPAWAERTAVHWVPFPGFADELAGTISLGDLLLPPGRVDLAAINPLRSGALGIAVWALAAAALAWIAVVGWRSVSPAAGTMTRGDALQRRIVHVGRWIAREHAEVAYFGAVGIVGLLLITPWASPVWDLGSEWPRLVPRDLLWPVIGSWAIVGAQVARLAERSGRPWAVLAASNLAMALVALTALPVSYAPEWPARHTLPTRQDIVRDELRGVGVAGLAGGWLLPRNVDSLPPPSPTLLASYQGGTLDKVARDAMPPATQVDIVEHATQQERLVIQTRAPVEITILTFNFPGWRADLNDREVPIQTDPDTGLMRIRVPEGRYDARIAFGGTPARTAGWLIALASVGLVIGVVWMRTGSHELPSRRVTSHAAERSPGAAMQSRLVLVCAVLWLSAASGLPYLFREAFTVRSAPGTVRPAENALPRALQGGIDMLAYDLDDPSGVKPGAQLDLTVYWRAVRPDLPDYQVDVTVAPVSEPEEAVSLVRHRHPGAIPSSTWPVWPLLDHYVRDSYAISIAPDTPAGEYEIHIQVGRCGQFGAAPCDTVVPLFVRDGRGSSLGQRITLPERITVQP